MYRTSAHIKFSSRSVFEQVKDSIIEYLAAQRVDVAKVEEIDLSARKEENLEITEIGDVPDVFQKAKLVGASHVLLVTVDRPLKSWMKLTIQCSDLSGEKLWEEEAANSTALIIGTPTRFQRGKQIGTYVGMIPCEESSARKQRLGHISKQGCSLLRFGPVKSFLSRPLHSLRGVVFLVLLISASTTTARS